MLVPKRVKFRKWQRAGDRNPGPASRGTRMAFGSFGLKSEGAKWVNSRQIEAARKALTHYIQRGGKVWIRIFPDKPITKKPPEVTMGGGKGDPVGYVFPVRPGHILFEIDGVSEAIAKEALTRAGAKLPVKVRVVKREHNG